MYPGCLYVYHGPHSTFNSTYFQSGHFFGLELYDGHLFLHLDMGTGHIKIRVSGNGAGVSDGKWHAFHMERTKQFGKVTLDGKGNNFAIPGILNNLMLTFLWIIVPFFDCRRAFPIDVDRATLPGRSPTPGHASPRALVIEWAWQWSEWPGRLCEGPCDQWAERAAGRGCKVPRKEYISKAKISSFKL